MNPQKNTTSLNHHLDWLEAYLNAKLKQYFDKNAEVSLPDPPPFNQSLPFDKLCLDLKLGLEERIIVLLALIPHLRPQALDVFDVANPNLNRRFTEFGGIKGKNHQGFLPTKETAVFILAGTEISERIRIMRLLHSSHRLFRRHILEANTLEAGEPWLSSPLTISKTFLPKVLWNENYTPEFGADFPAEKVTTPLNWEDLVLPSHVMQQVTEIQSWMEHEAHIQEKWALGKVIKPGYRTLFYGPPGTGKTLTALLLGKALQQDLYKIDLAMVVSKYIGETEKNLAKVFDLAVHNQWILFFDEADALFGKRTMTQSSNDRYANQEISYLLQRIEAFPGLIVLASNFKGNLDEAFIRRFQSMIHFPAPSAEQRLMLWQKAFANGLKPAKDVDLSALAEKYKVTGGEIINVLRYAAIKTAQKGQNRVVAHDILQGISQEFQKKGGALGL